MWAQVLGSAAGGSSSTDSGFGGFSAGQFGAVNIGAPASGLAVDQKSLLIIGAAVVVLFVVLRGKK